MIYTKTGDNGTTSLANGERVNKSDLRLETYGTADELNAYFGWLNALLAQVGEQLPLTEPIRDVTVHIKQLGVIQNKLFNLGAFLSCAPGEWLTDADVADVEHWIDAIQTELPPQHAFILPAGSEAIAAAHICRTVTRRLERLMVRLAEENGTENDENNDLKIAIRWVNRLSDYCFVLARKCANLQKKSPVEWKK
ncbi:MAG: cob(I)yrinic acid a,c-diamide adenosyltransferase [Paludibacteraceae bacterium]|nr:cob(I)yrinic acid a,c-diamide adenosyltransferase [Paludibacteraceae bacterium]